MQVSEVKRDIQQNKLAKTYIFVGDEWKVQQIYIDQMVSRVGGFAYLDSLDDVKRRLKRKSLLDKPCVVVVREQKAPDIDTWESVVQMLTGDVLILRLGNVDKRSKFYKAYSNEFVEFEKLSIPIISKYLAKLIDMTANTRNKLINVCEGDYGRCLLEVDKIQQYCDRTGDSVDDAFQQLLQAGTIYKPPYDAIFDFVDSVLDRESKKAYQLYDHCVRIGESSLAIMSVLFNNAKAVLQVQTCEGYDIAETTGLTSWQINNAKKHVNKYSADELIEMLQLIQKTERGIKTGHIDEEFAVPYIMTRVL